MIISAESANCFNVREVNEGSGVFADMIRGMLSRGVKVQVLEDRGVYKKFCIN